MRLQSPDLLRRLRCPACCSSPLTIAQDALRCAGVSCGRIYPVLQGVPILIDDQKSVFSTTQFLQAQKTYFDPRVDTSGWRMRAARVLYENTVDLKTDALVSRFRDLLGGTLGLPRVLVLGAGEDAAGMKNLRSGQPLELLLTDVSLTPDTMLICDAHDVPFESETFDGVIAQAVLEHVADPQRCVEEIYRVLRPGGVVFSDTPFMQQVHGGRYDFTRFTHLGHRRLFRRFEEIESGASSGPGIALTWAYRYFLLSFAHTTTMTRLLRIFAKVTSFWWKYFDRLIIDSAGGLDAASATYFIGRKSESVLPDRELIAAYRGADQGD